MRLFLFGVAALTCVLLCTSPSHALYQGALSTELSPAYLTWFRANADKFFERYGRPDGSIVDPENNGVTHSEAQAYAMSIAFAADDRQRFEMLWRFTREQLRRGDGLHSWKYVHGRGVADYNTASDADLLIAAILSLAAKRWDRGDYLAEAAQTAKTLSERTLVEHAGSTFFLPAAKGFGIDEQPDGPVINLSYYNYDVMHLVRDLAPSHPWVEAARAGFAITERVIAQNSFSDWTSVADPAKPRPAERLPAVIGYDLIRLPINMLTFTQDQELFRGQLEFTDQRFQSSGGVPGVFDARSHRRLSDMPDEGYRLIAAAVHCVVTGDVA